MRPQDTGPAGTSPAMWFALAVLLLACAPVLMAWGRMDPWHVWGLAFAVCG